MKTIIKISSAFLLLVMLAGCSGGYVITTRPEPPVVVRPVSPHPGYIWIDGNYYRSGNRYLYRQGYWAPPRHRTYISGSWQQRGSGWYWRKGRWH